MIQIDKSKQKLFHLICAWRWKRAVDSQKVKGHLTSEEDGWRPLPLKKPRRPGVEAQPESDSEHSCSCQLEEKVEVKVRIMLWGWWWWWCRLETSGRVINLLTSLWKTTSCYGGGLASLTLSCHNRPSLNSTRYAAILSEMSLRQSNMIQEERQLHFYDPENYAEYPKCPNIR